MKYVAFIDVLGFKEKIKNKTQTQASELISEFSRLIYREWETQKNDADTVLNGSIISDCAIVNTIDCSAQSLKRLIDFLVNLFKHSAFEHDFLLRAAIAKGEFEKLPTFSHKNLSKNLIVGQAYIDAYILEGLFKGSIITFDKEIYDDIQEINELSHKITQVTQNASSTLSKDQTYYNLQWAKLSDILIDSHLEHFVSQGIEGKWLPHYYQTLYMFMVDKSNEEKNELLDNVWKCISRRDNNFKNHSDLFIRNAFCESVEYNMQKYIARFIREKINEAIAFRLDIENKPFC